MLNNTWKIPIGDWSDDGHGKCDWFTVKSNFTVEQARDAYFKAVEASGLDIAKEIAHDFEDSGVSERIIELLPEFLEYLFERGLIVDWSDDEEPEYHVEETSAMAEIVCCFIKRYNSEFEYKIVEDSIPMLPFYGFDEKHRHIGHIGYGLFSL